MKKVLLILMALFAIGLQNVSAQDKPLKIVSGHPDFSIKVKRCAASGKTVIIDLILNNLGTNDVEEMSICGGCWGSEVYDDEGNIYNSSNLKVKVSNRNDYDCRDCGKFNIPTDVPMKFSICIEGVPQSAESIARIKLLGSCRIWGLNSDKPIKISNIPISRN